MADTNATFARLLVRTFSPIERQILALRYAEELELNEIAAVLRIPLTEVEETLNAIRARTSEALESWPPGIQAA